MKKISFNSDWSFYPCRPDKSPAKEPMKITLPHDATIYEKRSKDAESKGKKAYFPNGAYIYQKEFGVPGEWKGKKIYLFFEGIYRNAMIYVNEAYVGQCISGYSELYLDVSAWLEYGKKNQIKILLRVGDDSRWYAGAGIYRDTWLLVADPMHIAMNGVRLSTRSADEQIAVIQTEIRLENEDIYNHNITVTTEFFDEEEKLAVRDEYSLLVQARTQEKICPRIYIKKPKLWDCENPHLYTCRVTLTEENTVLDVSQDSFGVRTLSLDPVRGLCINGKTVKLYGGCIHHDNGILGAVSIDCAEERRIKKLREAGYNAIRSAHHPASRALLNACDKYGMTVMDELTDMWKEPKSLEDDAAYFPMGWEQMVSKMVEKDYNHPSVIFYSIGNEIPEFGRSDGARIARSLSNKIRELDDSRFITCGVNGLMSNLYRIKELLGENAGPSEDSEGAKEALEINSLMTSMGELMKGGQQHPEIVKSTLEAMEALDVAGYNYAEGRYCSDAEQFTNWISVGTETFPKDLAGNWKLVMENSNVLGDYSWTAWDYLGEAGIGKNHWQPELNGVGNGMGEAYPYIAAYCGDFGLTGIRRPQSYYREIVIGKRKEPYIAVQNPDTYGKEIFVTPWSWFPVVPTWTFPGCEGKKTAVEVYSNAQEVELFLNGTSMGRKKVPQETTSEILANLVTFEIPYEMGKLEAVAYEAGRISGSCELVTAEDEVMLRAEPEAEWEGRELVYIPIGFYDKHNILHTQMERKVSVQVSGAGELYGLGTGNPITQESYKETVCTTYLGAALAVIRVRGKGKITVAVSSEGYETVNIEFVV